MRKRDRIDADKHALSFDFYALLLCRTNSGQLVFRGLDRLIFGPRVLQHGSLAVRERASPHLLLSVPLAPAHLATPTLGSVWRAGACGGRGAMACARSFCAMWARRCLPRLMCAVTPRSSGFCASPPVWILCRGATCSAPTTLAPMLAAMRRVNLFAVA